MGGRHRIRLCSYLIVGFVFICQDAEAQAAEKQPEATTPKPTTTPPPPYEPMPLFGSDTDKDNLKGKVPWRVIPPGVPFNPDKDKYKPYVIFPPPKFMYGYVNKDWDPPKRKDDVSPKKDYPYPPNGYVNKDWDPPKRKDDIEKKKRNKELDDLPRYRDRYGLDEFVSMPSSFARCLDGDKKFLDDKEECKMMKKHGGWGRRGPPPPLPPPMPNYCWGGQCQPQRLSPWPPTSFMGAPYPWGGPPGPFPPDSIDPFSDPAAAPLPDPAPLPVAAPYPAPASVAGPLSLPRIIYPPYPFHKPYYKPIGYRFPYYKYFSPYQYYGYKPFFAKIETETPVQEPEVTKQSALTEPPKDKPEQKTEKPTANEDVKKDTKTVLRRPILL